jgi:adenylate kinase
MTAIAITGTPGVGKTTLGTLVAKRPGWQVVDVRELARQQGAVVGRDEGQQEDVIDADALTIPDHRGTLVIEGHLAHHLDVDVAWVVRCDPRVLRGRLAARGYSKEKIEDNLEAEALDLVLQEALETVDRVIQRDGTRRSPTELLASFDDAMGKRLKAHDLEPVDWSDQLPLEG